MYLCTESIVAFHMQESLQKSMHFDYLQYLCSVLSRLLSSSTASSWQVRDGAGERGMVSVTTVPHPHAPLEVLASHGDL